MNDCFFVFVLVGSSISFSVSLSLYFAIILKIKSKWGKKGKLRREKYSGVIDVTIIRYKQIEKKYSKHKHKHSNEQNIIKC